MRSLTIIRNEHKNLGAVLYSLDRLVDEIEQGRQPDFAVFHGLAHGAEMQPGVGAVAYSTGFLLATASLHGLGMALGAATRRLDVWGVVRFTGAAIAASGVYLAAA